MNRKNQRTANLAVLPMYLFSLVFVAGPLVYMLVLSFMTRDGFGFQNAFTLENYAKIFDEVYFATFLESLKLAVISTAASSENAVIGTPPSVMQHTTASAIILLNMLFLIKPAS